nr:hypothetical protein [Tanacetum cinerariifolium]
GTLVSPASTVAASIEVKTLAISSESLLILSAAASSSLLLLPLIGALSPDLSSITPSLSSKILTLSAGDAGSSATIGRAEDYAILALLEYCMMGVVSVWVTVGMGAVGIDGSGIDEVVGCDDSISGKGV